MTANSFSNASLAPDHIPSADDISFEPLDSKYARMLIMEWLLIWLIPTTGWCVLYGLGKIDSSVLSGFWPFFLPLLLLLPVVTLCPLYARHSGYALREHDIHFKAGVIWQKHIALPFCRIQHVEIERNPLERMLGLATLKCYTAGGGSADLKIPALSNQMASKLKAFVLKRAGDNDERA